MSSQTVAAAMANLSLSGTAARDAAEAKGTAHAAGKAANDGKTPGDAATQRTATVAAAHGAGAGALAAAPNESAQAAAALASARVIIPALKWSEEYRSFPLHDVLPLQFLKEYRALDRELTFNDRVILLKLLQKLLVRPCHALNKKTIESCKAKLAEPVRKKMQTFFAALNIFAIQAVFKDRAFVDLYAPGPACIPLDPMARIKIIAQNLPVLTDTMLSTLQLILDQCRDKKELSKDNLLRKAFGDNAHLVMTSDVLFSGPKGVLMCKNMLFQFFTLSSARKKILENKIAFILNQLQNSTSALSLLYHLKETLQLISLLSVCSNQLFYTVMETVRSFRALLPAEQQAEIKPHASLHDLDDITFPEHPGDLKSLLEHYSNRAIGPRCTQLFLLRDLPQYPKGPLPPRDPNNRKVVPRDEENYLLHFEECRSQYLKALEEGSKEIAKSSARSTEARQKMNAFVAQAIRTNRTSQTEVALHRHLMKDSCLEIFPFVTRLSHFRCALDNFSHFLIDIECMLKNSSAEAAQDVDVLWPEFCDFSPDEEAAPPPPAAASKDHAKDEKAAPDAIEAALAKKVEPLAAAAASRAPAASLLHLTCLQRLSALRLATALHYERGNALAKLSMQDASFHVGVLGSHLGLFQQLNSTEVLKRHVPHMIQRIVRSAAIASELVYTAKLPAGQAVGKLSHSHPELENIVQLTAKLPASDKTRLRLFLQAIDYGSVSSRYPSNTAALCEYRKLALPDTLQWLLGKTQCDEKQLTGFISDTLFFMECITGNADRLSEVITKELYTVSAAPQTKKSAQEQIFRPILEDLTRIIAKVKGKIGQCQPLKDSLSKRLTQTWSDALWNLQNLQATLELWMELPQTEYIASHVDAILLAVQLQDELIEEALHMTKHKTTERSHDLLQYRELREHELSEQDRATLYDFDVGYGAQYPNRYKAWLQRQDVRHEIAPRALSWRFDALNASLHSDAYDAGMTPAGCKKINPAALQKEIVERVHMMLKLTKATLDAPHK